MSLDRASISRRLAEAGCVAPAEEAEALFRASGGEPDALEAFVARRVAGEPLAWVTGTATFCELDLTILPGVYVPRAQSEHLALRAAELLPEGGLAADLCTGSGALAVVMASARPSARVVGTDSDPVAVRCARLNGVEAFEGSLDEPLPADLEHRVDVLTAIVPYVPTDALGLLPRDVVAFEPRATLEGGADGADFLREVAARSPRWLHPGGWLLLELGGDQPDLLVDVLASVGADAVELIRDEEGDVRGLCARLG